MACECRGRNDPLREMIHERDQFFDAARVARGHTETRKARLEAELLDLQIDYATGDITLEELERQIEWETVYWLEGRAAAAEVRKAQQKATA